MISSRHHTSAHQNQQFWGVWVILDTVDWVWGGGMQGNGHRSLPKWPRPRRAQQCSRPNPYPRGHPQTKPLGRAPHPGHWATRHHPICGAWPPARLYQADLPLDHAGEVAELRRLPHRRFRHCTRQTSCQPGGQQPAPHKTRPPGHLTTLAASRRPACCPTAGNKLRSAGIRPPAGAPGEAATSRNRGRSSSGRSAPGPGRGVVAPSSWLRPIGPDRPPARRHAVGV